MDLCASEWIGTCLNKIKWIWTRPWEVLGIWANLCEPAWGWANLFEIASIWASQSKSEWDWVDLGENNEWIWTNLNATEWIRVSMSDTITSIWDWVSLYASAARHQARQAKPHPPHQSPIQLWLGLSVLFCKPPGLGNPDFVCVASCGDPANSPSMVLRQQSHFN